MCRSIKPLFNFEPAASEQDVHDAARQFVRKISGYRVPSKANETAFNQAIEDIAVATQKMLAALTTAAPAHHREPHVHPHTH